MARKLILVILALSLCSFLAMAQSKEYYRIARLSYLEGKVSFQHTDEVDWTAASINMALQPGDRIYTGDNGRAEIEFDDGSILRLAEKADVEILTMKEQLIQMKVLIGLCSLTNRSNVQFEIDTPAAAFTASEKGSYRFDIAENGDSDGIVRKGSLEVANNHFSRRIGSGEVLHVSAAEGSNEVLARYDQRDAWDEWNDRRNADAIVSESRKYIADTVYYGVSDLDRYGSWMTVDGYGPAWVPRVSMGWSPYWEGRWQYRPLWGWTWVSYEPWGWLPYHYGRWTNAGSIGWCWIPGPSFGFHFWSPGLVRFYRGDNWVSWLPLGPGDYYDVNNYYFNFYNRGNLYYLNELRLMQRRGPDDLVNRLHPGAFRSVRTDVFANGSLGARVEQVRIQDPRQSGRVVTGNLDVRPTAHSYAPAPDRASVRPNINSRPVVVRTNPDFRTRGDRYVAVTNPTASTPRTGADPASGTVRGTTNSNMRAIPERNASPARTYQVPQSRPMINTQQGTAVQADPRAQDTTRTQPSVTPSRRMDSPTPSASSGSSSSNRLDAGTSVSRPGYSGGTRYDPSSRSSSGSVGSAAPSEMNRPTSVAPPSSSSGAASSAGSSRPSAPPASSGGEASAPVKKGPAPETSSNYAPRQYQSYRGQGSANVESVARSYAATPASRNVSRAEVPSVPQYNAAAVTDMQASSRASRPANNNYGSSAMSFGSSRSAAPQYNETRSAAPQYSAPRESSRPAMLYSAPRESSRPAMQYSAPRESSRPAMQYSAPRSAPQVSARAPSQSSSPRADSQSSRSPSSGPRRR